MKRFGGHGPFGPLGYAYVSKMAKVFKISHEMDNLETLFQITLNPDRSCLSCSDSFLSFSNV